MYLRSSGKKNCRLVWFDIETTGFNPFKNEIIEIAALDNNGETFESLISCNKPVSKKITEITNITNEMLLDKPGIEEVMLNFVEFIKSTTDKGTTIYLIGHNIHSFDLPFVKAVCNKYNIKFPTVYPIDTMRMSQFIMDEWCHSLDYLCKLFGIDNKNAHRALSDVYATQIVYSNLCLIFKRSFKECSPNLLYYKTSVLFR